LKYEQLVYWTAISELLPWKIYQKNRLVIDILYTHKISFMDFFNLSAIEKKENFKLSDESVNLIENIVPQIPSVAFQIENLYKQGIEIITLNDKSYPRNFKNFLKKYSPMVLYIKGNKSLLNEKIIAIAGSRDVSNKGILFTQNIAKKCVENGFVVSSGYARGVDKIALNTVVQHGGKSIAVIPQGISTFKNQLKKLYTAIIEGKVLVMSTFSPDAPWAVGRAMKRNKYIYGLAEKVYVAEASSGGGTWSGAVNGLKAKQDIYVRYASQDEKCANNKLIALGAKPVDMNGSMLEDIDIVLQGEAELEARLPEILKTLEKQEMNSKQLIEYFGLNITPNLLTRKLKQISSINVTTRNRKLCFDAKKDEGYEQMSLL